MQQKNDKIFDKKISCPNCKNIFLTKKPFVSKLRIVEKEIDGHKIYQENSPYLYEVNVCPNCGLAFSENINKKISVNQKKRLVGYFSKIDNFKDFCSERDFEKALRASKLSVLVAILIKEPLIRIAAMYLKISWLYRDSEDSKNERIHLEKARDLLKQAYMTEDTLRYGVDENSYLNLMSDISRRLDDYENAGKYYIKLLQKRNLAPVLRQEAEKNWHEYKENRNK